MRRSGLAQRQPASPLATAKSALLLIGVLLVGVLRKAEGRVCVCVCVREKREKKAHHDDGSYR